MAKYIKDPYVYDKDDFDTEKDYIKRARKKSREDEFESYGKNITMRPAHISKNKKKFDAARERKYKINYLD